MARQTKSELSQFEIVVQLAETADATIAIVSDRYLDDTDEIAGFSASGTAKRGKGDKYSKVAGRNLAVARALESLARKLRKEIREWL